MSTSTNAFGLAAPKHRRSSRKAIPNHVFGSAAVACLVLGCAWTVYVNGFGASVFPHLSSDTFVPPGISRPPPVPSGGPPPPTHLLPPFPKPPPATPPPPTSPP